MVNFIKALSPFALAYAVESARVPRETVTKDSIAVPSDMELRVFDDFTAQIFSDESPFKTFLVDNCGFNAKKLTAAEEELAPVRVKVEEANYTRAMKLMETEWLSRSIAKRCANYNLTQQGMDAPANGAEYHTELRIIMKDELKRHIAGALECIPADTCTPEENQLASMLMTELIGEMSLEDAQDMFSEMVMSARDVFMTDALDYISGSTNMHERDVALTEMSDYADNVKAQVQGVADSLLTAEEQANLKAKIEEAARAQLLAFNTELESNVDGLVGNLWAMFENA